MNFTKEEISLCKQVAKKHKKEIKRGNWILDEHGEVRLIERIQGEILSAGGNDSIRFVSHYNPDVTPLWTISDCLEFLRERKWCIEFSYICEPRVVISYVQPKKESKRFQLEGDTALEVYLKAVLAVLEEGK